MFFGRLYWLPILLTLPTKIDGRQTVFFEMKGVDVRGALSSWRRLAAAKRLCPDVMSDFRSCKRRNFDREQQ